MLHTVNASPYASSALSNCLRYSEKHSEILLLEDAVVAGILGGQWEGQLISSGRRIYVLQEDAIARGIEQKIASQFELIDMEGFVELTARHVTQMKW
ncbi:sulfurtransferase complex subunit TusB [Grimontia kaedaensis]|uniref:Sulfurtransferase complex subunit TusB n=1 Tax=Grimontia kaedaensis TaxID=2872157 RepID=A0ABY4WTB7_9GAMM|nr:sulfurtransferase complex subunit TusB [Grimontia kaedaensis]USH02699.1 sulfurtransferase complex subunit TusB [Grimontia kaedaensis]